MSGRLDAAEAALKAGRGSEAVEHLIAAIEEDPARPAQVYRVLLVQLYRLGRAADGEAWSAKAAQRHPRDFDILNVRGVFLRQLKRYPEALKVLDEAIKQAPKAASAQINRGNVLLDMGDFARAEAVFAKIVRLTPRDAEAQRLYGRALLKQRKSDAALMRLRQAVSLDKGAVEAWLDMAGHLDELMRGRDAEEAMDKALAANPDHPKLLEGKAIILRRSGETKRAEAFLGELLPRFPEAAWLHAQIGLVLGDTDRERANQHLRRAVELEPARLDYRMSLIESLERTRTGDEAPTSRRPTSSSAGRWRRSTSSPRRTSRSPTRR
ncbi:tetratricopeptide repeat protein [Phenylobacterium sp. J367]|uniref:tetratricopeptide repeat protein n=1 Tax=Phenylobacterium sp. J367 TaxID=2898435 RepID=UPI0021519B16|nr:tetratricopeptide repeat protein [Phenylobacterium sp. J367]MCR5877520.1 tetratricopeptide repeat protein [Phenylobacterium sp. J367]